MNCEVDHLEKKYVSVQRVCLSNAVYRSVVKSLDIFRYI